MDRPTLQQLNDDNDAARDQLLLLRILCSSDLSFLYMLYKPETLRDILRVVEALVVEQAPYLDFNIEEHTEFSSLVQQIGDYISSTQRA
jgi:hypothetical protein